MPLRLAIDFQSPTATELHRIRNLGEDLFRAFAANRWAEISLDDVDRATDRLVVTVPHRKQLRRVVALLEQMLADQHLDRIGRIARLG